MHMQKIDSRLNMASNRKDIGLFVKGFAEKTRGADVAKQNKIVLLLRKRSEV